MILFVWFNLFHEAMMISNDMYVVAEEICFHFFYNWVLYMCLCTDTHNYISLHILFISSSVQGHLNWFQILAVITWVVVNVGVQIMLTVSNVDFISFVQNPRSKIIKLCRVCFQVSEEIWSVIKQKCDS